MNNLINIKKAPNEILQLLCRDKRLLNLIYDDNNDAGEKDLTGISVEELIQKQYIQTFPPTPDNGIDGENYRNTYVSIFIDDIYMSVEDNNIKAYGSIIISTDHSLLKLKNNNNRLLEICDLILNDINKKKISCAGNIIVSQIEAIQAGTNVHRLGYRINYTVTDQQIKQAGI